MFQWTDDFHIDEDFLNDSFESENGINQSAARDFDARKSESSSRISCPRDKKRSTFETATSPTENVQVALSARKKETARPTKDVPGKRSCPGRELGVVRRRFPGPAGLLPEQRRETEVKSLEDVSRQQESPSDTEEYVCSQPAVGCFKEGAWVEMVKDYYAKEVEIYLPDRYSVSWLKTRATSRTLLGRKTPFLAAVIVSLDCSHRNPMVVLRDPTGEIEGAVHSEVWEKHSDKLHVGTVVVLRQVAVLTTGKKHYLNVTSSNLLTIYGYEDFDSAVKEHRVRVTRLNDATADSISQQIRRFERKHADGRTGNTTETGNPFFKSNVSSSAAGSTLLGTSGVRQPSSADRRSSYREVVSTSIEETTREKIFSKPFVPEFVGRNRNGGFAGASVSVSSEPFAWNARIEERCKKSDAFFDDGSLLDGLEESFLEDF